MLRLEFAHYDYKLRGSISAEDFALSMVASADMSHINTLLNRVDQLKNEQHLRDMRITFEEFKNFAELRRKLQPFSLALFSYGKVNGFLTRKDFQRAAYHVSHWIITFLTCYEFSVMNSSSADILTELSGQLSGFWHITHGQSD